MVLGRPVSRRILRSVAWLARKRFTAGSCAIVLNKEGHVLLAKNRWRGDRWGLPGGFLKRHESPEEALRRELAEEVGLTGSYSVQAIDRYLQADAPHVEFLYWVRVDDHFVPSAQDRLELRAVGWFPGDTLPELLPEAAVAVRKAQEKGLL